MGAQSAARAAYRIASFGNQEASDLQRVGQEVGGAVKSAGDVALQLAEHREINSAGPHAATIAAAKDQSWNDFITGKDIAPDDPNRQDIINSRINNPQMAQQWSAQNLEPDLEKFQGAFATQGGQQWAQRWADEYRTHFYHSAMSDQSQMAGAVVQANVEKTTDISATATFNDPSTLAQNLSLLGHTIEGNVRSSPTMTPEMGTKAQTELLQQGSQKLVQSAIQGAILKGGDWRSIASDARYAPYVKPAENAQFDRMEKFYQRGAEASQKQILLMDKQIAETNATKAVNDSWAKNVTIDPTSGRPTIAPQFFKDMVALPLRNSNAPNATELAKTYLDWGENQQKQAATIVTNPAAAAALDQNMFSTGHQTTEIDVLNAENAHTISRQDGATRIQLIHARDAAPHDPVFNDAVKTAQAQITGPKYQGAYLDPDGPRKSAGFMWQLMRSYQQQRSAGTLKPNALNLNDPDSLISQTLKAFTPALPAAIGANGGVGAPAAAPAAAERQINSKAEYDALAPGSTFMSGGKKFVKPEAAGAAAQAPAPEKGAMRIYNGAQYEFQGGDWHDKANWKPVS